MRKKAPVADVALTREEVARLSGFRLPKAAVTKGHREVVPALTVDQVRTLDQKYGLFDAFAIHLENSATGGPLVTWHARPAGKGIPRFYRGLLDVATARLAAWMFRDGLTYTQVVLALRTGMVRACLSDRSCAPESDDEVVVNGADVGLATTSWVETQLARPWSPFTSYVRAYHRFPLAWLGLSTDALPRVQKTIAERPDVWRHRWVPRAEAEQPALGVKGPRM